MESVKNFATILLLIAVTFASVAVDLPSSQPAANAHKIGVVSVSSTDNLSMLENELASKAAALGAYSYRIVAAGGQNKLFGTAEIYN